MDGPHSGSTPGVHHRQNELVLTFDRLPETVVGKNILPFLHPADLMCLALTGGIGFRGADADMRQQGRMDMLRNYAFPIFKGELVSRLNLEHRSTLPELVERAPLKLAHDLSKPFTFNPESRAELRFEDSQIEHAHFSPRGDQIVTLEPWSGTLHVWSLSHTSQWVPHVLQGGETELNLAQFSVTGRHLLVSGDHTPARLWSQGDDGRWQSAQLGPASAGIHSALFSPDDRHIVTTNRDGAQVWTLNDRGRWRSVALGEIRAVAFSANAQHLVTGNDEGMVLLWKRNTNGRWVSQPMGESAGEVRSLAFSPDSTKLAVAHEGGHAVVWTRDDQGRWSNTELSGHEHGVSLARFTPDGHRLITVGDDDKLLVWNQNENNQWENKRLLSPMTYFVSVDVDPTGKHLVTINESHTAKLWNLEAPDTEQGRVIGTPEAYRSAEFSSDGNRLMLLTAEAVEVWSRG